MYGGERGGGGRIVDIATDSDFKGSAPKALRPFNSSLPFFGLLPLIALRLAFV